MSLTESALINDRVTWVALVVLILTGIASYLNLPRAEDPGFVIRTAIVTTAMPGVSPERIELLVTDPLETAILEMPELDHVDSTSRTNVSVMQVHIRASEDDLDPVWDDLRRRLSEVELPDGAYPPEVNDSFADVFGIVIAMTGEGFSEAELQAAAERVRDEILRLEESARVEIHGEQEQRVYVDFDTAKLSELGLSPGQLINALETRNILFPGGEVIVGRERIALEPSGNFETVDEIAATTLALPGRPALIRLSDIAAVYRGTVEPTVKRVHHNGQRGLALSVSMRPGGDIVKLGEELNALLQRLETSHPIGLEMDVIVFQPENVSNAVNDFISNLIQSVVLVIVVMLAFLGLRTGLVVASLIPMTILATFCMMSLFGVGIDQISLAALIIALGMLVDNAIVMSESILVQMEEGKSGFDASVSSAKELSTPLLTSSLTTIAAFLPIYLAESNAGEYTAPLFKVVTIALSCSWLLSLVLIPLLSVSFLRPTPRAEGDDPFDTPFYDGYRRTLETMVRHRWITLGALVGLFVLSLLGMALLPSAFFPESDRPVLTAKLNLPTGTSLKETESVVWEMEAFMAGELEDEIVDWISFMGDGGPRFVLTYNPASPSTSTGIIILNARDRAAAVEAVEKLRAFCDERFPDLVANIRPLEMGPPVGNPIGFQISGRDDTVLFQIVDDLKRRLSEIPGVYSIEDDWGMQVKKLIVEIDQDRAMRSGVSSQDVAVSLQSSLSGLQATEFREGVEPIPVMLRAQAADRLDLDKLQTIQVQSQSTGRAVPLLQVADVSLDFEPSLIRRRDRTRAVQVEASLNEDITQLSEVNAVIEAWLREQQPHWPIGFEYSVEGRDKASSEANAAIFEKLPIAAFMIVFLLVFQFNSIRRPTIVLATLPLGLIGVVSGLLMAGSYIGFMTLLGIISLMGIIINNAVVLLDRIKIEIEEVGRTPAEAVIEAAQRRLRPILLTTATTIMGLVPLWVSGGPMWEPMAIAIIFGLAFATVLTLGAVPVLYSIFFRVRFD